MRKLIVISLLGYIVSFGANAQTLMEESVVQSVAGAAGGGAASGAQADVLKEKANELKNRNQMVTYDNNGNPIVEKKDKK